MRLWNDRRLRLSLTGLGLQYLLALLAVGAFSVNTGNNLLYLVFSIMLGLFLVSGILSRRALQGLQVVEVVEGSLFARSRGGLRLRLRDGGGGRLRGLELHLDLEDTPVEPGFLGAAGPEGDATVVLQARPGRRGWLTLRSLELRTRFPFGMVEKSRFIPLDQPLLVLPHPRMGSVRPGAWRGEGRRPQHREGTGAPLGARPLRRGDPPGRMHWKRTAQRGQPWVRTFDEDRPAGLELRLDLGAWNPGPAFEGELERLSGAVLQARIQRREVSLELAGAGGLRAVQGAPACWRALALAQAERGRESDPAPNLR